MDRVYLDHNATTPLRVEARAAMIAAMDVVGNPSSVHAEGRAAKLLVERARVEVADLVGCKPNQVIFTGSATEAAALAAAQANQHGGGFSSAQTEHDCVLAWHDTDAGCLRAVSAANSETGVMQVDGCVVPSPDSYSVLCDITQMAGKMPVQYRDHQTPSYMILSAHKIGGPKGVGALINFTSEDPVALLKGGGQEMGRRSGTENIVGIAGFGAAATAARRDVAHGRWERVAELRNILEKALEAASKKTIFVGKAETRLPNTSCFITPGWKGETQVMQMDLSGFAISAGSACSSGKVRASKVLLAMGYSEQEAASAVRVSLGLDTSEDEIMRFADVWADKLTKHEARAA
ncbi:Cysteine desulfurase NifS [Ascidiaceihabitans donghaensis]|uniref:Cysteine desulfurase n=1 Tax=Ascidiaceihabitans donghaensis TaxID=1510460 RepID=A0A2R8BDN7_9RHOB|nr:aminotransferase class V-fold PLP-dependent enzyme [Ascidiaceihabitans donghaensis]SPH21187.1 Cysteine desulfurase NifS [Ascidiaceihabitans donghaensis]